MGEISDILITFLVIQFLIFVILTVSSILLLNSEGMKTTFISTDYFFVEIGIGIIVIFSSIFLYMDTTIFRDPFFGSNTQIKNQYVKHMKKI